MCVRLLQSGCFMHLLNNKNGVAMKLIFIWKGMKNGENLLNNIITIDETWVRAYEPEISASQLNGDMKDHCEDRNYVRIHLL